MMLVPGRGKNEERLFFGKEQLSRKTLYAHIIKGIQQNMSCEVFQHNEDYSGEFHLKNVSDPYKLEGEGLSNEVLALREIKNKFQEDSEKVLLFLSDGCPLPFDPEGKKGKKELVAAVGEEIKVLEAEGIQIITILTEKYSRKHQAYPNVVECFEYRSINDITNQVVQKVSLLA